MKFSTFDIATAAPEIKKLHDLLVDAIKKDIDGSFTITNEEADAIGSLVVEIADRLRKS